MKKVFSLLITLAMLISTAVVPMSVSADADVWDGESAVTEWTGEGTEASPYLITSAAELAGLAKTIFDADEKSTAFVSESSNERMYFAYTGKHFKLTTDIDLGNQNEWTPIGRFNLRFDGIFDGGEHVVKNVYMRNEYSSMGFFGATGRNARIFDLGIDGIDVSTTVGSPVDYVADSLTKKESRVQSIGGFIGAMCPGGTADVPMVESCFVKNVKMASTSTSLSHRAMGAFFGTAGYLALGADTTNTGNHVYLKNCYTMNVDLTGYSSVGAFYGGGWGALAWDHRSKPCLTNCYAGGDIVLKDVAGSSSIDALFNMGSVYGSDYSYSNVYTATNAYTAKDGAEVYANKAEIASSLSAIDGWSTDNEKAPMNDGYPVLAWQNTWSDAWDGTTDTDWAGEGTAEKPYLITSAEELAGLAKVINETNPTTAGLTQSSNMNTNLNGSTVQYYIYTDKYFKLTADLDLKEIDWLPVGIVGIKFDGHFDGNNHVIKNLKMTTQRTAAGLFGAIGKNARITNIGVENVKIQTAIGSLAEVNDWDTNRCIAFGGLVGMMEPGGSAEDPVLKGCFAKDVYIKPTAVEMGIQPMGGLVGSVAAWSNASASNDYHRYYISDCYVKDVELYSHSNTGAFMGGHSNGNYSCPAVTNCYVAGDISLNHTTGKAGYKVWTDSEQITEVDTSTKVSLGNGWPEDYTGTLAVATNNKTTEGKVIHVLYTKATWNSAVYNFGGCLSNQWANAWVTNCYTTSNAYSNHTTDANGLVTYATNADTIAAGLVTGNNVWNLDSVANPINGGYPVLGWEKWWTVDTDPQAFYKGADVVVEEGKVTKVTVVQSDSTVNGEVVVAVYNGERFESAATVAAANGAITLTTPLAVDAGDTVKVFVWNSLDGVSPLGVVYSTTISE